MINREKIFRNGLIDFQVGQCHDTLPFSMKEYVMQSFKAKIQQVCITCKDAYGHAYYKSEYIKKNNLINSDYLEEAITVKNETGIKIIAYYNVLLDDVIAKKNPSFRMKNHKELPVIAYDYYEILCPNSPYLSILHRNILELVTNYDIDGLFLDISYFQPDTCFCQYCQKEFKKTYNKELLSTSKKGSIGYCEYLQFRRKSRYKLLNSIKNKVKKEKNIMVMWNGSGAPILCETDIDDKSDILSSEFHAPDFLHGIFKAKWMKHRKEHFIMAMPYELGSWGDWTVCPSETLRTSFMTIVANGGGLFINHVPYPSGQFASHVNKYVLDLINKNFSYIEQIEQYLDVTSVHDIAIILSSSTIRLFEWFNEELTSSDYLNSCYSITSILLNQQRQFDIIGEDTLLKIGHEYKLIIMPNSLCISENTVKFIKEYVNMGGNLISNGAIGLYDEFGKLHENFSLKDVIDASYEGDFSYSVDYLYDFDSKIQKKLPDNPLLLNKYPIKACLVKPHKQVTKLASLVEPMIEASIKEHVYHQHAHPARRSEYPGVISSTYGKGKSLYFASDPFSTYHHGQSPWINQLINNCIDYLLPDPIIKVKGAKSIIVSLMKQKNRYILHLLNINGPLVNEKKGFPVEMIPVYNTKITLNTKVISVKIVPEDIIIPFIIDKGKTIFTIDKLINNLVIVIETGDKL